MQQQMQVVVPQGVSPGMAFQVNTPTGMMQVICPDGAYAGGNMLVNVPVAAAPVVVAQAMDPSPPVPVVVAQAMDPSAPVPMAIVMPPQQQVGMAMAQPMAQSMAQPMAQSMAQPMVMTPQDVAPVNNTIKRGPMDDRMREVSSGCYYQQNSPCCFVGYLSFNEDRSAYSIGPVYCCCVLCCPCPPGCCGNQKAVSLGSSVYNGDSGEDVWQSSTKFIRNSSQEKDSPYVKC